jgi:formate/nitrite transporter FocA (FNT family)
MTFITVFAGPIGLTNVGWKFWLWVLSGDLVGIAFVFFLCPKTGGKTLEQVDYLFTRSGFLSGMKKADQDEEEGDEKRIEERVEMKA